jgi:uncharacterized MAPEG superfamily protein
MTPDLYYLAYSAVLTALLWVPYVLGQFLVEGPPRPGRYRDPTPPELPNWVRRCNRAHQNAVENLNPFAAVVMISHVAHISNPVTAMWAATFFWSRVAHAVIMWLGIPYLRTVAFLASILATFGIFWEIVIFVPPG